MSRPKWNYVVDVVMFALMGAMIFIGVLMGFFLSSGPVADQSEKYVWGLHLHQWGDIHTILSFTFVAFFTVIDHREYEGRDGTKYRDQVKLYPAKFQSVSRMQKKALKLKEKKGLNGLEGCTFEVSRSSSRDPRCGNLDDFVEHNDVKDIVEHLTTNDRKVEVIDYEKVVEAQYLSGDEMREQGVGGKSAPVIGRRKKRASTDAEDEL